MSKKHSVYETAKKHGESKKFHYANIMGFASVLLSVPASIYLLIKQPNNYTIINILIIVIAVVLAFLKFCSFLNISQYFKGEVQQFYGLKRYFQLEIASYFLFFLTLLANFCVILGDENLPSSFTYGIIFSLVVTALTLPLLLPLKKAIDHGIAAADDRLASKITVPMKVLTILYCFPNITALSNMPSDNWISIVLLLMALTSMIGKSASQIMFATVLFEYDGDIQRLLSLKKKNKKKSNH